MRAVLLGSFLLVACQPAGGPSRVCEDSLEARCRDIGARWAQLPVSIGYSGDVPQPIRRAIEHAGSWWNAQAHRTLFWAEGPDPAIIIMSVPLRGEYGHTDWVWDSKTCAMQYALVLVDQGVPADQLFGVTLHELGHTLDLRHDDASSALSCDALCESWDSCAISNVERTYLHKAYGDGL